VKEKFCGMRYGMNGISGRGGYSPLATKINMGTEETKEAVTMQGNGVGRERGRMRRDWNSSGIRIGQLVIGRGG